MKSWFVFLILGLICNVLGIILKRQGNDPAAITLVVLGIVNVATSFVLHHNSSKSKKE